MIKKLDDVISSNDDIVFSNGHFGNVTFSSDEMGIISTDLNSINLDGVNFDKDDLESIIHIRVMAWRNRLKQSIAFKKELNKELIRVAWHPAR